MELLHVIQLLQEYFYRQVTIQCTDISLAHYVTCHVGEYSRSLNVQGTCRTGRSALYYTGLSSLHTRRIDQGATFFSPPCSQTLATCINALLPFRPRLILTFFLNCETQPIR